MPAFFRGQHRVARHGRDGEGSSAPIRTGNFNRDDHIKPRGYKFGNPEYEEVPLLGGDLDSRDYKD